MDSADFQSWRTRKNIVFPVMELIGTAYLKNWKLSFNYYSQGRKGGAANIMPCQHSVVYGLLFEIDEDGQRIIRKKEGYPNYYAEISVDACLNATNRVEAYTYKVNPQKELPMHQKPTISYMNLILTNALKNHFPDEYLRFLTSVETQGCDQ